MKKQLFSALVVGLCLTANLIAQVPNYVPTNGLVGWWPFNANANDESGNGNNGTVNGATLTTDRFGNANKAYSLDGVYSTQIYVDLSNPLTDNKSFSFWVKYPLNYVKKYSHLIEANTDIYISICGNEVSYINNNVVGKLWENKAGYHSNSFLNNDVWRNVVVVCDYTNSTSKVYIDGLLDNSSQSNNFSLPAPSINELIFGSSFNNPNIWVENKTVIGLMDDIGIWNRALTECEVADLYNSQINSVAGSILTSPQSAAVGSTVTLSSSSTPQS